MPSGETKAARTRLAEGTEVTMSSVTQLQSSHHLHWLCSLSALCNRLPPLSGLKQCLLAHSSIGQESGHSVTGFCAQGLARLK